MKKYFAKLVPVEGKLNSGWDGTLVRDTKGKYGDFILTRDIRAVMTVEEAGSLQKLFPNKWITICLILGPCKHFH